MKVIGLTGGIGTGKSTASSYLKTHGFAIIDADRIAREVVEPGQPLLNVLQQAFGSNVIRGDGTLDRKGLAAIVFHDTAKRQKLDCIMHGRIIEVIEEQICDYSKENSYKGIIIDAPLLLEAGLEKKCSQVWLLTAENDVRIHRVCQRDGATPEEVQARINNQMDDAEKKKMADLIIDNSGGEEELKNKLKQAVKRGGF